MTDRGAMEDREAKPRLGSSNTSINELFRLDDRTILITGGGGAVGLEVAKSVVESGGDAICLDMSDSPLEDEWRAARDAAERHGQSISYYKCDITDEQALTTTFESAMQQVRHPLRGLVTCHGISAGGSAMTFSMNTARRLMDVNFTGTFSIAQLCAREFQDGGQAGSIVLIASMSAHGSNRSVDTAAYNSSKAAVVQLARSLAAEFGSKKDCPLIRVNTISPGYIRTRQTSDTLARPGFEAQWSQDNMMMRLSYADEYRGAVQYLLSDASSFVTGSDLRIDGGHTAW